MSIAKVALTPFPTVVNSLLPFQVHEAATDWVSREYGILPRVAGAVTNCAHNDLAAALADLLRPFVDLDCLDIVAFEEDRPEVLWHSVSGTQLHPGDVPIEQTKLWWVYQHQQPLCIADWSRDDRFAVRREALKRLGCAYRSLCCVPLRTSRHRFGVLRVASLRPDTFSEDQVRFLYAVADQLAFSMSELVTRERLRKAESRLEVSNARFEFIMSIVNRILSSEQFGGALAEVTANTRRILDSSLALVALSDGDKGSLRIDAIDAVNSGLIIDEETRSKLAARINSIKLGAEKGKPWTGHVEALDEIVSAAGTKDAGPTEACVIPLLARGKVLGCLALARGQGRSFTGDEVAFASHVATQLALAIGVAVIHREQQELCHDFDHGKVYVTENRSEMNFEEIVGKSASLVRLLKEVEIVAPTDSGVLILGETGTGKELIARAIHDRSSRRHQRFVKLNCAAIPSGLLESELFGHEKGAFTGAIIRKAGRFEVADKGTLFLDEVGDIPLDLQPKLLRVLQEHEFERLGSTRTQHVDVRVIAATHRDLKQMVNNGRFRSDLYYRLNVFPLTVPPLRDRVGDIPMLVRYYVDKYARRMNRRIEEIPTSTMDALCGYCWPGNVRELQNFIERAVILSQGEVLRAPLSELQQGPTQSQKSMLGTLEDMERKQILQALHEAAWVIGGPNGAAARLGMKRTTLAYRIRKLRIPTSPHQPC